MADPGRWRDGPGQRRNSGATASESPVNRSVEIAISIAKDLIQYCEERSIPFGFNIESVAIRKEEIEASHHLLNTVSELLKAKGLRKKAMNEQAIRIK
jgi:hypothetical protein